MVDRDAAVCNHCGRPSPAKMRKGEKVFQGIAAVVLIGYLALTNLFSNKSTTSPAESIETVASTQDQTSALPTYQADAPADQLDAGPEAVEPPAEVSPSSQNAQETVWENNIPVVTLEHAKKREAQHPTSARSNDASYSIRARLSDPRGKVVIQSEASMMASNVDTIQAGVTVLASGKDGKWIGVRLEDGRTGFVRLKQLEFY